MVTCIIYQEDDVRLAACNMCDNWQAASDGNTYSILDNNSSGIQFVREVVSAVVLLDTQLQNVFEIDS